MLNLSKKQLLLLVSLSLTVEAVPAATTSAAATHKVEYDVIVVGGGAGGLVSSAKFAEAGLKTLLLERGGPMMYEDGNKEIPDWTTKQYPGNKLTLHDTMLFYQYGYPGKGGPNADSYYCKNVDNLVPCMLGGGTSVNAAQQWWPPRQYLANTFKAFPGWSPEIFQQAISRVTKRIPLSATWSADNKHYYDEVFNLMGSVFDTMGLKKVDTLVDGDSKYDNYGRAIFATNKGDRGGPLVGYLQPAKKLPNFTLMMYSPVTSVVRTGNTITGVEVNGTVINAKNVVISAGAWNTPALLFASGIGPKAELQTAMSIKWTKYLEKDWIINDGVGANLHDNPATSINLEYNGNMSVPAYDTSGAYTGVGLAKKDLDDLYLRRTGPLTSAGRIITGWLKIPYPKDPTKYMGIQTTCNRPTEDPGAFQCQFCLNEGALSRGRVSLGKDGRLVFAGGVGPWLTNPLDTELFATAMMRFVDSAAKFPDMVVAKPKGPKVLADYIKYLNDNGKKSNNHWGGSCSIGLCVDEDTLVHGTANLFVVDGSLSPAPTSTNPAFLYEAMAEIASDRIIKKIKFAKYK